MQFQLDNEEATQIMSDAIRAMVPVPAGYEIESVSRTGAYTNATVVTLKKIVARDKEVSATAQQWGDSVMVTRNTEQGIVLLTDKEKSEPKAIGEVA